METAFYIEFFPGFNQETGACHYKGFKVKRKIDCGLSCRGGIAGCGLWGAVSMLAESWDAECR
ncbi:MAG: hypothetical protein C4530_19130 [Desulfobacteraceae bacterium]|nr:MAG: hypothetical protein C4530_19130 [Desulfobacteraceae bacterium]